MQLTESLCKLGDGGITDDTILFKQITSYFNQGVRKVATALLRVDTNWHWDDTNYTDFPIATIDLVTGQRDYTLPASTSGGDASTLWKINRIRIKDTSGLFRTIFPLQADRDETHPDDAYQGRPLRYRLIGNSVRLSAIPKTNFVTLTGGLEIQFQRSGVDFTTSDTTKQPGFTDAYHELPAFYASYLYLLAINTSLAKEYKKFFDEQLDLFGDDWANKNDDAPQNLIPKFRSSR